MWMEENIGRRINVMRVEQALPRQPLVIATGCPYCATMMSDGVKALEREPEIATRDIVELVAEALAPGQSENGAAAGQRGHDPASRGHVTPPRPSAH